MIRSRCFAALLWLAAAGAADAEAAGSEVTPVPVPPPLPADPPDPDPDPDPGFDPWKGMDRSGRIPAIEKPADLPNPERWRYIPEGRLRPGNVLERFGVSSVIAPFVFRSSDVGWGGGVAVVDLDFRTQRRREFAGIFASYSQEQQQAYWIVWRRWLHHLDRKQGGVLQEERSWIRATAGYSDTLTRRFYGFGAGSRNGDETRYSDELFAFSLGGQRTWPEPGADLMFRAGVRGEFHRLSRGVGSNRPNTRDVFPALFAEARQQNMGSLRAGVSWDTRDSQTNPYAGWELAADVDAALLQSGWDVGAIYALQVTRIFELPGLFHEGGDPDEEHPPTDTLALGLSTSLSSGDLPFFALPALGGDRRLRGYPNSRFRDDASWLGAIEYRFWVLARGFPIWGPIRVERLGLALFYEIGSVASGAAGLFRSRLRHSYGPSLRITLERAAPFRVDFGLAPGQSLNITARFGLSF